ncbi:MAG: orotidine-5'-phosphate decarboxylase [Alphaproteobacteria bacterium]|nr:orotidine-5'-phosphate decarboxylase [Alphaproteobacteria bacterium]
MVFDNLVAQIKYKKSFLCVGLDPDMNKMPDCFPKSLEGIYDFLTEIIDATKNFCIAYKLNIAFFEVFGSKGWDLLEKILAYLPASHFIIADAKRGDISHSAEKYAQTFFETYSFDALTVSGYLGIDSLEPFFSYKDKSVIILGLTSNSGSQDFQQKLVHNSISILDPTFLFYELLISSCANHFNYKQAMFVVGATKSYAIQSIRNLVSKNFLLIPGIGAQGGNLEEVIKEGKNRYGGLIINVGRDIMYASNQNNFGEIAYQKAQDYQQKMALFMK